jgi:hypothetical protein
MFHFENVEVFKGNGRLELGWFFDVLAAHAKLKYLYDVQPVSTGP